ncbi:MAG: hypothetical protein OEQ53_20100 [Saprospiraceae bacterium]|nr:hypothetical protein [Saprospiraceae bacterium]
MNQSVHFSLTDEEFTSQFSSLSLAPSWFTHEAHLRLTYILIKRMSIREATEEICGQIKAFDSHHGDGQKYHRTITVAAVKTVAHFAQRSPQSSFEDLMTKFPRLKNNFIGLLKAHYSPSRLADPEGKVLFLESDLLPYDS